MTDRLSSANPLQSEYALQIPKLKMWAEQATRRAENEKRRLQPSSTNASRYTQREVHWEDEKDYEEEDAEMRQRFVEYQVKLVKEEEERKIRERATYIQAEKEAKLKAEQEARQVIEKKAIEQYRKQQEDMQAHKLKKEETFRKDLAGLGLGSDKIQSIIDTAGFRALEQENVGLAPELGQLQRSSSAERKLHAGGNEDISAKQKATNGSPTSALRW